MTRYVCTVAVGFVLALMGTATASANGLPVPGQEATQEATQVTSFGDQSVGEQKNDADVTQEQGNGNFNLSPAIGIGGDATTTNEQGNDNVAKSDIDQENDVDQSQDATQKQSLDQSGGNGCCTDQSQSGEQKTYGGDQKVEEQKNDADVTQKQGNGNVNIAPAIAVFGDAETTNEQGNDNVAKSDIDQKNDVDQSQSSTQKQELTQSGGSCCEQKKGYGKYENGKECGCNDGQSQTGEQKTSFGDQKVEEQKNDADVTQKQGNGNVNVSPAVAIFGDAKTTNKQGNGNYASPDIDQKNDVDQSQDSYQRQSLDQSGSGGHCCSGSSQTGEQKTYGGDQKVEKQKNDADVDQWQGNGNLNVSPAIAIFGDAETRNYQGNGNVAKSDIDQKNDVDQSQSSTQKQELTQSGGSCCEQKKGYGKYENGKECGCNDGQSQTGEQKTSFGDQKVEEQKNDADVTQKQGNWNGSFAPAIAIGGKHESTCNSRCGNSFHPVGGNATTTNAQGNGNYASSDIDQKNDVDQSQDSYQRQSVSGEAGRQGCCSGSQTGEQRVYGGDQKVEEQKNDADIDQWQGNGNGNFAPAIALGGDATTQNYQGNHNVAKSDIDQKNDVDQSQDAYQRQSLVNGRSEVAYW